MAVVQETEVIGLQGEKHARHYERGIDAAVYQDFKAPLMPNNGNIVADSNVLAGDKDWINNDPLLFVKTWTPPVQEKTCQALCTHRLT